MAQKFTVVWGNIGDGHERRIDHVEAEPTNRDIMQAARQVVQQERINEGFYADDDDARQGWDDLCEEAFDGYAVFDGHIFESAFPLTRFG